MPDRIIEIQKRPVNNICLGDLRRAHLRREVRRLDVFEGLYIIWSSMMYQILKTLNEQLRFEEFIDPHDCALS